MMGKHDMIISFRLPLLGALLLPAAALAGPGPSATGFWVTQDHSSVVEVTECGGGLCGRVVGLRADRKPGDPLTDIHNPDPSRHTDSLCGLTMMGSLAPVKGSNGAWDGGWVYDPESGHTYSAEIRLEGPDTLKLRGFLGISLFGRSEVWTRETGVSKNRCALAPA
jgi:uncharacterized protein (DUF2147 family)